MASREDFSLGADIGALGKVPPHHLEAERSILGAILVQNEAVDQVCEVGLKPHDFYRENHQKLFEVALSLYEKREPIDLVTMTSALKDRGWFEGIGGTPTLTSLFDDAFAVGNISYYAKIVREKSILRRMIETCMEISQQAFAGVEDTEEFLDQAEAKVFHVTETTQENTITELKKVLLDTMKAIEDMSLKNSDVVGLSTGFKDFDKLTTGLHPGQIMIVAARPGMGKTSWFISALQHAALKNGAVCALYSLEMSKEEIGFRFLSGLAKIDSRRLKVGKLADRDWQLLAEAASQLAKSKIFIDDSGGITVMDIRSRCRRLIAREKKLDLIVVDYLQLMKGLRVGKGESSREREISEISRGLKELAKELKVPIIVLSQLNRGVESRQDKRPMLSDLRESGAIEQDADLVCFIHREDYYNKETEEKGIAEFIVAKNRAGETSTVRLAWLAQFTLFENMSSDSPGAPIHNGPRPKRGDITL